MPLMPYDGGKFTALQPQQWPSSTLPWFRHLLTTRILLELLCALAGVRMTKSLRQLKDVPPATRGGLVLVHVQPGAAQDALPQAPHQLRLVHQAAPADVHQHPVLPQRLHHLPVHHALRLLRQRAAEHQHVAAGGEVEKRRDKRVRRRRLGRPRVVGDGAAEGGEATRHAGADVAEAHDPHPLAAHLSGGSFHGKLPPVHTYSTGVQFSSAQAGSAADGVRRRRRCGPSLLRCQALGAPTSPRQRPPRRRAAGAPLPAFLAASATTQPEPPRAALVVGDGAIRVDSAFLDAAPYLRCVVTTAAGLDHVDLAECARRGVLVAGAGEVFSTDVADHAVGLLIDVLRRVSAADRYVRRGMWPVQGDYPLGSKLGGKRVGIIGLGRIGSAVAKRLKAFGCVIQYHSRRPKDTVSFRYFPDVVSLAAESDVLIVACALNDQTRHIVNKEVLEALGKDGVVVNIACGGNIDEAALIRALKGGGIAGAGLDVFEKEPDVPAELLTMDNVVLTAHEAVFTMESGSDLCDLMIRNLEAFFDGKPLLTPVLPK